MKFRPSTPLMFYSFFALSILSACGGNERVTPDFKNLIVGEWQMTAYEGSSSQVFTDETDAYTLYEENLVHTNLSSAFVKYRADGRVIGDGWIELENSVTETNVSEDGQQVVSTEKRPKLVLNTFSSFYEVDGDKIIINGGTQLVPNRENKITTIRETSLTITQLNADFMTIKTVYDYTYSDDFSSEVIKLDLTVSYQRVKE